jgi:predicted RecA/RadA family phage recombinase
MEDVPEGFPARRVTTQPAGDAVGVELGVAVAVGDALAVDVEEADAPTVTEGVRDGVAVCAGQTKRRRTKF